MSNQWRYSYSGADVRASAWFPHSIEDFNEKSAELSEQADRKDSNIRLGIAALSLARQRSSAGEDHQLVERGMREVNRHRIEAQAAEGRVKELQNALQDTGPWPLESIHTVSFSVHEPRGAARALGYRGVKGFASSVRTIAGSMIFTVVEGHPLETLMLKDDGAKIPWSIDYIDGSRGIGAIAGSDKLQPTDRTDIKLATMLSPFNVLLIYQSEVPRTSPSGLQAGGAALMLKGVQLMTEGIVTSVNDMVTEIVYQFVAEDLAEFSQHHFNVPEHLITRSEERSIFMKAYEESRNVGVLDLFPVENNTNASVPKRDEVDVTIESD